MYAGQEEDSRWRAAVCAGVYRSGADAQALPPHLPSSAFYQVCSMSQTDLSKLQWCVCAVS